MHQQIFAILLGLGFASAVISTLRGLAATAVVTAICGLAYYLGQARDGMDVLAWGLTAILPMMFYSSAFIAGALIGGLFRSATSTRRSWRLTAVVICAVATALFVTASKTSEAAKDASYAESLAKAIAAAKELVSNDARVLALTGQVQEIPLANEIVNRDAHKLMGVSLWVKGVNGNAMVETSLSGEGETLQLRIISVQASN